MKLKKIIWLIALLVLSVVIFLGYKINQIVLSPNTSFSQDEVVVFIPSETNYDEVLEILDPFIAHKNHFTTFAKQRNYIHHVMPGKFILKKGMNNHEILMALRKNIPVRVTFNNQERLEDFAQRIGNQIEADSLQLMKAFTTPDFLAENDLTESTVLAACIPNTYEFYWNTTAEEFRGKMIKEYRKFWNPERIQKASILGLTPVEVSILASIVHKETNKVDERSTVAGVYLNRLKKGMPLQADPTVIFAVKKKQNDFTLTLKRVLYADLETDSPYNTYRNAGLPPGLIFMPDVNAIDAVLQNEKHDYLFFCASVERFGYHEFATTLEGHGVNRRKYQKWINQRGINR
jgi:UPF0755 protein